MATETKFLASLEQIPEDDWNALWPSDYPFTQYRFLHSLEVTGCVNGNSGWQSHHCVLEEDLRPVAAVPIYAKEHSYGEYVFDWGWANAYHAHGLDYYPKLVNAIPFTPATGPRWGMLPATQEITQKRCQRLNQALREESLTGGYTGIHSLFPDKNLAGFLSSDSAWKSRWDCQYHWFNQDYRCFDDFLQQLTSRKRKNIKKERQKVAQQGVSVAMLTGQQLTEEDWRGFYTLYRQTYLKRSGSLGYLNADFFTQIGAVMADQIVMAKAYDAGRWVAAALYFFDSNNLYGRYWGCIDQYDALHFECCYYQGIEFAISRQLQRFDPGAQGEHKVIRGFQPVLTCSFHFICHPQFSQAIAEFLDREKQQVKLHNSALREQLPFKEGFPLVAANTLLDSNAAPD